MKLSFERELKKNGYKVIAGVDEAGRGPLAGPIVAAAVILPSKINLKDLADSKMLNDAKRQKLYHQIKQQAVAIGVASLDHLMIDKINIGKADLLAMKQAVQALKPKPDFLLVDGEYFRVNLGVPQSGINDGDKYCASIAAASIIAKVTRDRIMKELHHEYPEYGFDNHKGYGTPGHLKAIEKFGPCPIHRRSFFPLSEVDPDQQALNF